MHLLASCFAIHVPGLATRVHYQESVEGENWTIVRNETLFELGQVSVRPLETEDIWMTHTILLGQHFPLLWRLVREVHARCQNSQEETGACEITL